MCDICGDRKFINVLPAVGSIKVYPCPECSEVGSPELLSFRMTLSQEDFVLNENDAWNILMHQAKNAIINKIFEDKMYEASINTDPMTFGNILNFQVLVHPGPHIKALRLGKQTVLFNNVPNDYRLNMLRTLV